MDTTREESIFNEIYVSPSVSEHLQETVKWCRFLGIAGGILLFFFAWVMISLGTLDLLSAVFPGSQFLFGELRLLITFFFLLIAVALVVLLLRFAFFTRRGLVLQNAELFKKGLQSLKYFYIVYALLVVAGIITNLYSITVNKF